MSQIRLLNTEPIHIDNPTAANLKSIDDSQIYILAARGNWNQPLITYYQDNRKVTFIYPCVGEMTHKKLEQFIEESGLCNDTTYSSIWQRGWIAHMPGRELIPCLVSTARDRLMHFALKSNDHLIKSLEEYDPIIIHDFCLEIEWVN